MENVEKCKGEWKSLYYSYFTEDLPENSFIFVKSVNNVNDIDYEPTSYLSRKYAIAVPPSLEDRVRISVQQSVIHTA